MSFVILTPYSQIIPLRNGSGQYWYAAKKRSFIGILYGYFTNEYRITAVANSGKFLNVNSGKTDNATEVWLYNDGQHPSCKWYLRLYEKSPLNCPDVGKGN